MNSLIQVLDDSLAFTNNRRFLMKMLMASIAAAVCMMCVSTTSFADEIGKMANEMKGEMGY